MGQQEQDRCGRDPLVPDGDAVESTEGALDRRQQGREHEAAGQQEDGLGPADLSEEPACRLVGRPRDNPQHGVGDRERDEHDGAGGRHDAKTQTGHGSVRCSRCA